VLFNLNSKANYPNSARYPNPTLIQPGPNPPKPHSPTQLASQLAQLATKTGLRWPVPRVRPSLRHLNRPSWPTGLHGPLTTHPPPPSHAAPRVSDKRVPLVSFPFHLQPPRSSLSRPCPALLRRSPRGPVSSLLTACVPPNPSRRAAGCRHVALAHAPSPTGQSSMFVPPQTLERPYKTPASAAAATLAPLIRVSPRPPPLPEREREREREREKRRNRGGEAEEGEHEEEDVAATAGAPSRLRPDRLHHHCCATRHYSDPPASTRPRFRPHLPRAHR
jgi:hypothetical protein